eukprot:Tamp_10500.p1 GENE.Tamp_10500~~Tamp_10500.p1  ORF type:complete len:561 (-),score=122.97 Tamp_10500:325-2007(-)
MVDRGWAGGPLDTGRAAAAVGDGEELTVNLNVAEATGLTKTCDCYCVCTLQLGGPQLAVGGGLFSPRSKVPGTQLLRTETVRRSDTPRWRSGQAQFRHRIENSPDACLEISLLASRMLGSELLGRTHIELASLLSEEKTDRWYPVKSKNNQETGNVRLQTAGGRAGGSGDGGWGSDSRRSDSHQQQPMAHPRNSLMYLQNNPPPGTPGGIPAPNKTHGQRPPQRPGVRGAPPAPLDMQRQSGGVPPPDAGPFSPTGRGPGPPAEGHSGVFSPYGGGGKAGGPVATSATFQYKCGDMVGKGAFGKVYQALNLNSGELMAVKCVELGNVSDADMEEIRNEVQLLRSLKHRHVVQYIATHQMEGSLNILMEFCPGGSVATLLRSFGPLPESVLAQYSRQMMEGIGYIHQHQVMHRDIKGANILVAANGVLKIADFGASAQLRGTATDNADTCSMRGTPFWMAPEVIKQERYGRAADCWSAGMTMIEMATGMHPWPNATNKFSLMYEIASTDHLPIDNLPPELSATGREIILKLIKRKVEDRITAADSLKHPFLAGVQTLSSGF